MEGYSRKDESCPKLLDLLQKENKKWVVKRENETIHGFSDEEKLQLSLGPPGGDYSMKNNFSSPWSSSSSVYHQEQQQKASFLELKSTPSQNMSVTAKESLQPCCNTAEKKGFLPTTTTAVTNTAQKRTAPAPVVGWPPIRSFRKNIASNSSTNSLKSAASDHSNNNKIVATKKSIENNNNNNSQKGQFVKINMDGIPIGRKVDLKAYDSYEKLSSAVDELFRGLLAAQNDSSRGIEKKEEKSITGLLDGSGEYTLLYEDSEGDTMLVGNDVPWNMFVSTVKRLRVLKRSELPMLRRGAKHGKISLDS